MENETKLKVNENNVNEENGPQESVCSSGYGSNGTSEMTLFSACEDANSSRSASAEETPDHLASSSVASQEELLEPSPNPNVTVVKRPKNSVEKITALQSHRASYPTVLANTDHLNLNRSFGSVHSSSSNVSIERLTATDDEVNEFYK